MSRIEDGLIFWHPPAQCDLCGKVAELRPYGPKGDLPAGERRLEAFERKQKEKP